MKFLASVMAGGVIALGLAAAAAPPPLEAYGDLPAIRQITLSPDGQRVGLLKDMSGEEVLQVITRTGATVTAASTANVRARNSYFANNDAIVLRASERKQIIGYRGDIQYSASFGYTLETGEIVQLLSRTDLYPAQSGLGKIVGLSPDGVYAFMPAYANQSNPRYNLYRTKLDTPRARKFKNGTSDTIDWFVDEQGEARLREDYNRNYGKYELFAYEDGRPRKIREIEDLARPTSYAIGLAPDGENLVYYKGRDEGPGLGFHLMSLADGTIGANVFEKENSDIAQTYFTRNRVVLGVRFSGMQPSYEFLEPELDSKMDALLRAFPDASVFLESWTQDFSEIVVKVEGSGFAGDYFLFDTRSMEAQFLATERPDILPEAIANVEVFTYTARDGLPIEAVLTGAPADGEPPRPLILLPHGGPAARDSISFDWMAQFFASRGYAVLQPNFRGSSGYGLRFAEAGYGEWGGKMQDDLSDGVTALAETGRIDPDRVCIVGASYGGYAALMGGATTPEMYKCVIAIAAVTDPKRMLREELVDQGRDSPALAYWKEQLGVEKINDKSLNAQAPVKLAESFDDPVLLLHGDDDTVVPMKHSREMEKALKRAGKYVRFVKLKDEDHWLSLPETRIQLLREMDAFLAQYLPVNTTAPVQ